MLLQDILAVKGNAVYTIGPDATLTEGVQRLVEHNVGSLLVSERDSAGEERLLGIITERDILHACARGPCPMGGVTVREVMSPNLVTASPEDGVEEAMGLMTTKRVRHLPVLASGRLVGLVSIGDVVKAQHERLAMENRFMKDYITSQ